MWNRSDSERAAAVAAAGAARAATPAAAVSAAPARAHVRHRLPGGRRGAGGARRARGARRAHLRPADQRQRGAGARASWRGCAAAGGRMLAGGILGYPRHIGRPETVIMYAGDAAAFEEHAATLADLAGGAALPGRGPGTAERRLRRGVRLLLRRPDGLSGGGRAGRVSRRRPGRVRRRHAGHGGAAARSHRRRRAAHRDRRLRRRPGDRGRAPGRARSAAGARSRTPACSRS